MQSQRKKLFLGCGALLFLCAAFACLTIVIVTPTRVLMAAAGFERRAATEEVVADQATRQQPTIDWSGLQGGTQTGDATGSGGAAPAAPQPVGTIAVNVNGRSGVVDSSQLHAQRVEHTQTAAGEETVYVEYNEAGATALLNDILINGSPEMRDRISNPEVELRPGTVVVYGDADLQFGRQRVGLVLAFNESGTQFDLAGIDIGGQLYSVPSSGYLADMAQTIEQQGNQALSTATIQNGLSIEQISISEGSLQILAK